MKLIFINTLLQLSEFTLTVLTMRTNFDFSHINSGERPKPDANNHNDFFNPGKKKSKSVTFLYIECKT